MKGTPSVMPFGFDQAYQRKVDDFLAQLAFRYDDEETISGFAMTGAGTLGIEFHVCETDEDIANWEEAAMEAHYAHKHDAIQECTWRRIDSWADLFSATTVFFCRGNPWSNPERDSGRGSDDGARENQSERRHLLGVSESQRAV